MEIFSKSLYDLDQIKARSKVGVVDGIELLFGYFMKEDPDILNYAKDHFNTVSLESWDYFYDGAGLDLMSERKDVRETSRKFIDSMMNLTVKYSLFPFSMHLVSGAVPFRLGDDKKIVLKKEEENLRALSDYIKNTYGPQMDRFCFENCLLLDFMGGDHVTLGNVGKVFDDTIAINGRACFDISHFAINFLTCHEAGESEIRVSGERYPKIIPENLSRETLKYKREDLNEYLGDLISNAPTKSIQRFHFLNMFGIDPKNCEGSLEGYINLERMVKLMNKYHPGAIIVPEVQEKDYLVPVNQKKILDLIRTCLLVD